MTNSQKIFCFAPLLDIRRWGVPTACSLYHIIIYYQACSLCEGQYPLNLWVKILLHIHPPKKRVLKRIVNDCSKSENMKVSISRKNISDSLIRPLSSSLSYASFGCSYACTHTHSGNANHPSLLSPGSCAFLTFWTLLASVITVCSPMLLFYSQHFKNFVLGFLGTFCP